MDHHHHEDDFEEPTGSAVAGRLENGKMVVERPPTEYQKYMATQGIPIYEGPGFHDVRELDLKPWDRLGGNAAFLVPDGTIDLLGMHVIEIPPGEALAIDRHIYEEKYYVVEGEGSTEVWATGSDVCQRFEWHDGSLFAIPINTSFRLINGGRKRCLLIVGNTSPFVMNIFENLDFVFNNDFAFTERYEGSTGAYDPDFKLLKTAELQRAMWRTNLIPDIANCELPLDNQRSPGFRRIEPNMANGNFTTFIGHHLPGRYSKAHTHPSFAVLICIKGEGYTYNWPSSCGPTPWADGHADQVERVDYVAGGLVAAAPGGGNWFHQHFPTGSDGIRMLVFMGGVPNLQYQDYAGRNRRRVWVNADLQDGGSSISYDTEDPFIREEYQRELAKTGVPFDMPREVYQA